MAELTIIDPIIIATRESDIRRMDDNKLISFLNEEHTAVERIIDSVRRQTAPHAINIGRALVEAKRRFGAHGQWIPWVRRNLRFDERMAQRYMALAKNARQLTKKISAQRSAHITIRALEALTQPPKAKPCLQDDIDRAALKDWRNDINQAVWTLRHFKENMPSEFDATVRPLLEQILS